ncbi:hypothetical protein Rsub_02704 [Raphidocelis subcapitata]|uniref:Threonylcarbamoyl-AMP synthase n=1 Tax=Raphidocelis subcapitata TaxID=307507 RepID=A0A2V0NQQ0_9CHLO|nr:hypothetical protein Rsub_02704 [Raphidocelis subcapitata]|eukprot:GBF89998.1 hypothetical protein Rsub_02704 [Raphidocelis subcapitata]
MTSAAPASTVVQKAVVRCKPEDDSITISLTLAGRLRNMDRRKDEPLERALARIRANVAPGNDKKQKRQKQAQQQQQQQQQQAPAEALTIALYEDAEGTRRVPARPIPPSTPNGAAWPAARLLRVGPEVFAVLQNPPTVESLSLPAFPLVGYPLLPVAALAFADERASSWRWLRLRARAASDGARAASDAAAASEWEDTGCSGACYVPTADDIGCRLRAELTPARAPASDGAPPALGDPASADAGPVAPAPPLPAAAARQLAPPAAAAPPAVRVMSYNILADQYAGTSYAQKVLFDYCPTPLLDNNYRRQLVLEEVAAYQPDVLCLQEVDDKVFSEYLRPHLARLGFEGRYTNKQGRVREGAAMFWRASRFSLAATRDLSMRDVFKQPLAPLHAQFEAMLDSSPHLAEALQKVTTIAQISLLVPVAPASGAAAAAADGGGGAAAAAVEGLLPPLAVANTHLFFHPFAPHIRSMHTAAMLEEVAAAIEEWGASPTLAPALSGRPRPSPLFVGDLNSDLNSGIPGVVELLRSGRLAADHWDWRDGAAFRWGKEEGEYAEEQQESQQQQDQNQQQQQQHQAQQQPPQAQQQQEQQPPPPPPPPLPLRDGHDFDPPGASPTAPLESPSSPAHGVDLVAPFKLASSDRLETPYTNYTSGYKALLDYVWHDPKDFEVVRQLPCPPEQLLGGFIPSPRFPSDHLAVAFDLAPRAAAAAAASAAAAALGAARGGCEVRPALPSEAAGAAAALAAGRLVLLPTDTLYGVAADASSAAGVAALRAAKRRAPRRPLAIALASEGDVARYCSVDGLPPGLLRALLPGPVTLLLPLAPGAPLAGAVLDAGGDAGGGGGGGGDAGSDDGAESDAGSAAALSAAGPAAVGVRVPQSEFARAAAAALGGALALSSANVSGGEGALDLAEAAALLPGCAAAYDAGRLPAPDRSGSTVVDLTGAAAGGREYAIAREGVAAARVCAVLELAFGLRRRR